jgi:uncharacterized delta-60 repeat protein
MQGYRKVTQMRSTHAKLLAGALVAGATLSGGAAAQAGFDPTYGVSGIAMVPLSASSGDRFLGSTPGPGGTTYATGFTTSPGSPDQSFVLAKLRSDGSLDAEFGTGGVSSINLRPAPFAQPAANADGTLPATPTGNQEVARGVLVQSDGKIVITGQAETPASPAPFDVRDVDVYAVRFNADGTLDTTYGGANSPDPAPAGVSRINMTDGDAAANTLVSDNAWGALINPDDTVVIEASRGTDIGSVPAKTDRDLALIKLKTNGDLDASFSGGAGGVPGISIAGNTVSGRALNDNARRPKLTSGNRIVASSYGSAAAEAGPPALPAIPNTPAVYRFMPNGALDTSYSGDGLGSGTPLGPAPAFSEAYDVAIQEGERYVLTGYGNTGAAGGTVDMVAYRFKANGDLDPTFGTGGVTRYDAGIGQEDRGRDINVTSEGRIVIAGSSSQGAGDLIAAVYLLRPNGQFEKTFGDGGAMKVDFGGNADAFFGLSDTASDTRATVAGYKGAGGGAGDDAAVVRLNLDLENTGPAGAPGAPATGPGGGTAPGALVNRKAKIGTMKLAGSVVSVPLTCAAGARCKGTVRLRSVAPVRVGRSVKVISVTRTAAFNITTGKKTVRLALSKAGRSVLSRKKTLSVKVVVKPASGSLVTKRGTLRRK